MPTTHLVDDDGDTLELTYFDDPGLPHRHGIYVTVDHGGDEWCAGPFTVAALHSAVETVTPTGAA